LYGAHGDEEEGYAGVWSIAIHEGSFKSNYYTTRTLADIFITASSTQVSGNISLDLRTTPNDIYWRMMLACLPKIFYVQVDDYDELYAYLSGLDFVTIEDAVQVNNDQQLYRFAIETIPGSIPTFECVDDIPVYVQATLGQALNRNNHVNKPVDPDAVRATEPIIPLYITAVIEAICAMDPAVAAAALPFILSVPPFLAVFGYDGPMEIDDVVAECRDAIDFLGYIVIKCLMRAYIEDVPDMGGGMDGGEGGDEEEQGGDLNGYPLLMVKVWLNACLGRYSGTEPSAGRFDVEAEMMPRGPNMSTESLIQCWLITFLDKHASDLVSETITTPWLMQFMPPPPEDEAPAPPRIPSFDDVMSTTSAVEGFLGDVLDAASHLHKSGMKVDLTEIACRLSPGHTALGFCEAFCAAYDDTNRNDSLFLRLFEILPDHLFPGIDHTPHAIKAALTQRVPHEDRILEHVNPTKKLFNQMQTKMISGHVLRQAVEFRAMVLAAAPDVSSLPFVVQGESFVVPYHSISSSPMILYVNQVAAIHLKAYALATMPALRQNAKGYEVVELPSHTFFYNQGVKQHDYMYFFEAWGNRNRVNSPAVFTAIINLSSRAMSFNEEYAGRAINVSVGPRVTNRNRIPLESVTILPGHMHIYRRKVCQKDHGGRPLTHQTRLGQLEDHFDEEEYPFEEDQAHVTTDGILYIQISIAVYDRAHYGRAMQSTLRAVHDQLNMSFIGGLLQSSIYQGKQAGTDDDDEFVDPSRKTKRYPYPLLYNQLTNAHRRETRLRFIGNLMMQRPEISDYFYQDVLFIYNGSAPSVDDRIKLLIPKNGRAYDAQKHALDLDVQAMSFEQLYESGRLSAAFRKTDNNSTFTTKDELAACNVGQDKYTRIYPCIMPPLRNLHGVPGMFSVRDHYMTSTAIGFQSRFQPLQIKWI
jgi:DNA-binding MltR family transcriptional regulator